MCPNERLINYQGALETNSNASNTDCHLIHLDAHRATWNNTDRSSHWAHFWASVIIHYGKLTIKNTGILHFNFGIYVLKDFLQLSSSYTAVKLQIKLWTWTQLLRTLFINLSYIEVFILRFTLPLFYLLTLFHSNFQY